MSFVIDPIAQITDVLRIITVPYPGASPVTLLNLHDGTNFALVGGTFKVVPPERKQSFAESGRRYGGARLANETHGNGQVSAEWYIRGDTADESITYVEQLLGYFENIEDYPGTLYIAWQPTGTTYPVLYEMRAATNWEPQYRWIEFKQNRTLHLAAGVQVAPLAQGLSMRISDRFDTDSSSDYNTLVGAAGDWAITNGELHGAANFAVPKLIEHKDRGYEYGDLSYTFNVRASAKVLHIGGVFRYTDANNYVRCYLNSLAGNTNITIQTVTAGVLSLKTAPTLGRALNTNEEVYFRCHSEGPRVYGALWLDGKRPEQTADLTATFTPTGADLLNFRQGVHNRPIIYAQFPDTTPKILSMDVRPFRYMNDADEPAGTSPNIQLLDGHIPGSAPAKVDSEFFINTNVSTIQPVWALVGWLPKPPPFNMMYNGDFYDDVDGWTREVAGTDLHVQGTTMTRITTQFAPGAIAAGQAVLPATLNAGVHYKLYQRFLRGQTYRLKMSVKASTGTPSISVGIGNNAANSATTGTVAASSTDWVTYTVDWTPSANHDFALVYLRSEAASAMTLYIGKVQVVQGTIDPTLPTQTGGRGAVPPFGRIKAMYRDQSRVGGFDAITEGTNDTVLTKTSLNAPKWEIFLDPALLAPDPFYGEETQIEVWARMAVITAPVRVITSLVPEHRGYASYTAEFGRTGKVIQPIGSVATSSYRLFRLGTVTMRVNRQNPNRYKLKLDWANTTATAGSIAFEEIYLCQPSRRMVSPSGRDNDDYYPKFFHSDNERKRILYDLSGESGPLARLGEFPDSGLGGEPFELDPGENYVFFRFSDAPPDNPSGVLDSYPILFGSLFDVTPRWYLARD